jgi:hypothetical protein
MRSISLDVPGSADALEPPCADLSEQAAKYTREKESSAYFAVPRDSLAALDFSVGEAFLIVDALNGVVTTEADYPYFWTGIEDAIDLDGLDAKWQVDRDALMAKLRDLSPDHCLAIVGAANRFWSSGYAKLNSEEILRRVGLVK